MAAGNMEEYPMKRMPVILIFVLFAVVAIGCSYTPERVVKYEPEDTFGGYDKEGKEITAESTDETAGESVDVNIPLTAQSNKDAIAVVIGNRNYSKAKNVDYALNDARAVRQYLTKSMGFRSGNIFFIENATKGDFELYFGIKGNHQGKLFNAIKRDRSDVFVFYSGHGAPSLKNKRGYFVPVEADPQYIELGGYPLDVFYENISRLQARSVTVVLDACFSGANIFENISPMVVEVQNPVVNMKNSVVLSSSSGSQVSSWHNEQEHGMFTYFFLKSIQDRNADFNKDNELTFDEIYRYIADKSEGIPYYARRIHGVDQNPTIQGGYKGKVLVKY
jgi:hypothetical protein